MQRWLYQLQQAPIHNTTILSGSASGISASSPLPQQQIETTPELQAATTKPKKSGGFFSRSKRQPS